MPKIYFEDNPVALAQWTHRQWMSERPGARWQVLVGGVADNRVFLPALFKVCMALQSWFWLQRAIEAGQVEIVTWPDHADLPVGVELPD